MPLPIRPKQDDFARILSFSVRSAALSLAAERRPPGLLAVERERGRATEELESLEGQVRYYDQRVALSDLRVTLIEPGAVLTTGAFYPVVEAIRDSARVFAESAAGLLRMVVRALPWLILAVLGWIALRRFVFGGLTASLTVSVTILGFRGGSGASAPPGPSIRS